MPEIVLSIDAEPTLEAATLVLEALEPATGSNSGAIADQLWRLAQRTQSPDSPAKAMRAEILKIGNIDGERYRVRVYPQVRRSIDLDAVKAELGPAWIGTHMREQSYALVRAYPVRPKKASGRKTRRAFR